MSPTTITRSKPFYLVAGAGDLAVKTLREVRAEAVTYPAKAQAIVSTLPAKAQEVATTLPAKAQAAALGLPAKAQTAVVGAAVSVVDRTDAVYEDLLGRGRNVVGRIRRQKATQDLKRDAGTTVRRSKATKTSAKKSAATTRKSAKSTATSARKTATSAAKAARDGGAKLGS
jgi:hypothetical protein